MTSKENADAVLGSAPASGTSRQYEKTTYLASVSPAVSNDEDNFDPVRDAVLSVYERLSWYRDVVPPMHEPRLRAIARRMLGDYGLTRPQLKAARDAYRVPVFLVGKGVVHVD